MSDKKSKSKSKSKSKQKEEKPAKDTKSKKSKQQKGDKKSKKSEGKGSKKSIDKKLDLDKSISKNPDDIQSQSDFSMFKPFLFNPPPQQVD